VAMEKEVQALEEYLEGRGWKTARELERVLGYKERKIRALAEESAGKILSGPGCPGYRLASEATPEECAEAANRMVSQGKRMIRRGIAIRNVSVRRALGLPSGGV